MTNTNGPETKKAPQPQIEITPESAFQMLQEAIAILPPNQPEASNAQTLLEKLKEIISEAERLDHLADKKISEIEMSSFAGFTKAQLIPDWIQAKKLASGMIDRAVREALHTAIAIRREIEGDQNTGAIMECLKIVLDFKVKRY